MTAFFILIGLALLLGRSGGDCYLEDISNGVDDFSLRSKIAEPRRKGPSASRSGSRAKARGRR